MGNRKSNPRAFGTTVPPIMALKDRLGRDLTTGDGVLVGLPIPPLGYLWEVVDLVPNLDPRAQPNTGTLRIVATLNLVVPLTGATIQELLLVRSRAEVEAQLAEETAGRNGSGPIAITDGPGPVEDARPLPTLPDPDPRD